MYSLYGPCFIFFCKASSIWPVVCDGTISAFVYIVLLQLLTIVMTLVTPAGTISP